VIKSYYDEALNKWMIALLDVNDGKDQMKGQLMIMNIKGVVFFPLTFFYFQVFLLFVRYEIWFVLHEMLAPRSNIGNGTLFFGFSFMLKMWMVWNGWQGILVVEENKY